LTKRIKTFGTYLGKFWFSDGKIIFVNHTEMTSRMYGNWKRKMKKARIEYGLP
jgi:hypothetical protein